MKRYENQQARPTAGCLSVPLFNQKKRSRLPLTSNPSEKKFCSGNEYMPTHSSASSIINTSGNTGYYQDQAPRCPAPAVQHNQCSRQGNQQSQPKSQCPNSQPVPVPVGRSFAPSHPYHTGNTGLQMGQPPVRQDTRAPTNPRQSNYNTPCSSGNTQSKPVSPSSYSQMGQQQSGYRQRQDNPTTPPLYSQQSKPTPPPSRPSRGPGTQEQNTSWKFITTTNTEPQKQLMEDSRDTYQTQNTSQSQVQHVKPATENSLRILTTVIDGIRHWSHFKGRAPYLFEIFATLDSAVTAGSHGAKNFLMRDGKEVVQCVFYENELELPRLIRGQVHRCVGNYDHNRDTLTCVSVRAALPSEQRNAHASIKASDAEMRDLVKSLSEV
ncbi:spermatogenesis-associated protein 22-like isoform X1 [Oncorhynchus keta]|uniref:spermatogenesis-associated protein 22-like isoform X1 n=2 Tax=Oncorhynchus keta TaxID=8018 RepID=UPI0015F842FE|nr:spermatogenesis-associated protein 22-like isoform X1 [Oncorhynchus keta]XP_052313842.1 spermatogenesis-associated protein 22-like isoform X1 [Oncorhynchus keta]XP_052313843.1 spermatogenesis-associated protein 22-like isoform X1 [Oncorhynchus keta]